MKSLSTLSGSSGGWPTAQRDTLSCASGELPTARQVTQGRSSLAAGASRLTLKETVLTPWQLATACENTFAINFQLQLTKRSGSESKT